MSSNGYIDGSMVIVENIKLLQIIIPIYNLQSTSEYIIPIYLYFLFNFAYASYCL